MPDAKFFEQFGPACVEIMRDNFEVTGEVGVVVQLADGGSLIVNPALTGEQRKFAGRRGSPSRRSRSTKPPAV